MKKNLDTNRMVIITGGNRGIGESISRAFVANGDYVLIGSRKDSGLAKKLGRRARFIQTDVDYETDHERLARAALAWKKQIDIYINCAGFSRWSPIENVTEEFWSDMIDANLKGTFWGCKTAVRHMKRSGNIINISSIAGKRGSANNTVYCASKFGVNGLTQALAKEVGPRGIRVNAVCPVYVATKGILEALSEHDSPAKGKDVAAYLKKFTKEATALGRLPTGDDIANVCLFLASAKASAITGQCINVDCGVLPQ